MCRSHDRFRLSTVARDPLAYRMRAARSVLETITGYSHEQGLTTRRIGLEEIFAPSTIDLCSAF